MSGDLSPDRAAPQASRFGAGLFMLLECLSSAWSSICAHKMRSFLTMLGVIIGVASVIAVIALVQGLTRSVAHQYQGLGASLFTVRAETPFEDALRGQMNRLRLTDLEHLQHRIEGIQNLTPVVVAGGRMGAEVRNGATAATGMVLGTTERYQDVHQVFPRHGRFLTESDDRTRRRVVVLGDKLRRDLKLPDNPVGRYLQVGGEWFKVVGLMEPRGELFGLSQDNYLAMPFRTALAINGIIDEPDLSISFTVIDLEKADAIKAQIGSLLRSLRALKPDQPDDFVIESSDSLKQSFSEITTTITLVVSGVVGISLLVGGVGIMNIMLVSVTERTREIGIAKALGAPRAYILVQFLLEAMLLAMAGGILGVLLGFGIGHGVGRLIPNFPEPSVPWWAILGACGFSGFVGMVFGVLPAGKAANLRPIEALRYE